MFKRGEFDFVWLFAIIVGGLILFLAIYGAIKFGGNKEHQTNTEIAKQIATLTDPMQAGFAESSYGKIEFREETQIRDYCVSGGFGKNEIAVATREKLGKGDWTPSGGRISLYNKYIFSEEINQGEDFFIFSKPFEFPYKVNDLIFLSTKKYCFKDPPEEISSEILSLKIPNIEVDNCSDFDIKVCFSGGSRCDINVYGGCPSNCESKYSYGTVEKDGDELKYVGSLLYGAIFADKSNYDCNVQRLINRNVNIAAILSEKADLMTVRDCSVNMKTDVMLWKSMLQNTTVDELISLYSMAKELNRKNGDKQCNLW